jgi:hypothetical protein
MKIIYRYIVCILLFTCLGFTQDTLITKQGKQYIGKVIDSDSKSVEFSYSGWDTPKRFYLNGAEVFLGPKVPKSYPIYEAYKNYKDNKNKLKKEKKIFLMEARKNSSFLIKEKAIYDAKRKARRWVLYPTFVVSSFFALNISTDVLVEGVVGGIVIPYFILDNIYVSYYPPNYADYNDLEKEIYNSLYKKTFKRRKLLYSALGIPVAASVGFIFFDNLFDVLFLQSYDLKEFQ